MITSTSLYFFHIFGWCVCVCVVFWSCYAKIENNNRPSGCVWLTCARLIKRQKKRGGRGKKQKKQKKKKKNLLWLRTKVPTPRLVEQYAGSLYYYYFGERGGAGGREIAFCYGKNNVRIELSGERRTMDFFYWFTCLVHPQEATAWASRTLLYVFISIKKKKPNNNTHTHTMNDKKNKNKTK